jgi:acetyltransferase-like isoleucine patch superfamily enzyme
VRGVRQRWAALWMRFAHMALIGRTAVRLAGLAVPPYKGRLRLAQLHRRGYIAPSARLHHPSVDLGEHIFIGERVVIYGKDAGKGDFVKLGDRVCIHQDSVIETGLGGRVVIGAGTTMQPRCQISAYVGAVEIGCDVQIAPGCAFYPYQHGMLPDVPMKGQPLTSKGTIAVGDGAWLGFGVVVLDGVRIGAGSVIGAGAVVTADVPDGCVAVGVPARVIGTRGSFARTERERPKPVAG